MDPKASTLLGFTDEEVIDYFEYYLERAADEHDITRSTLLSTIKLRCGGYRFSRHDQTVFNPSSLLHSLAPQQRKDFPQTFPYQSFAKKASLSLRHRRGRIERDGLEPRTDK